jgi:hypothetical protein
MANLNLSQFTEKTLVADADWVFVWDTAGAISKKVSRNSLLNSGTLTTSAPVTISQTWADVAQTFKALVVNAAGTSAANSATGSLLLDLQVGGVSQITVRKDGAIVLPYNYPGIIDGSSNSGGTNYTWGGPRFGAFASIAWSAGAPQSASDTILLRDGADNTLALRNGAAAQTFNIYGTSSSGNTVYERMFAKYNGTDLAFQIGTETVGATLRPLEFVAGGLRSMVITSLGRVAVGDINPVTRYPSTAFEVIKSGIVNGPLLCLRSNIATTVGSWSSIAFGDQSQSGAYLKGALIYETTSGVANGKFHIALNNAGGSENATLADARLTVLPGGNVGIGTTAPSSKLQVTGGDVEIETVTSGIIMKAAGTSTRYRITLNAGGTALVFTAI